MTNKIIIKFSISDEQYKEFYNSCKSKGIRPTEKLRILIYNENEKNKNNDNTKRI